MNVNLGIWDKLSKLMVFLLFVAGVTAVFFWYLPLIQKNQRYRREIIALDGRVEDSCPITKIIIAEITTDE